MEWKGREIRFNDYGSRTVDIPLDTTIDTIIPNKYHQSFYGDNLNGCVWLAACQLFYVFKPNLSERMIKYYSNNLQKFEFLRIFENKKSGVSSLDEELRSMLDCHYRMKHVKPGAQQDLTDFILNTRTSGYFVAILRDNYGATTHVVGIDSYRRELYDAMEPT